MHRRDALRTAAAVAGASLLPAAHAADAGRKRIASINSVYYKLSHAYHIAGRMMYGYTVNGKHHQPPFQMVRMYNDKPDLSALCKTVAAKKGFAITDSVAAALGGKTSLDVGGVLLICEHGPYPRNDRGQILYPRYEMFEQIVDVFKASGRSVPMFVDKHLSYDHVKARKMYDTAKAVGFPVMAGSSLPVTFRRPEVDLPLGAKVEEAVVCFYSDPEIYGFHALETLQCLLERRAGGETGVKSVAVLKGDAVWKAWDAGAWNKDLAEACLRRSPSRDYGTPRDHVETPYAFRLEYIDGTRATLLLLNGYVADLTAAVKLAGDPKPLATWFTLPQPPGARFFDPLTFYIEEFFTTGKSPYPVERTLLTSVVLDFALRSLAAGGQVMSDPAMAIKYQPSPRSFFFRGNYSDD